MTIHDADYCQKPRFSYSFRNALAWEPNLQAHVSFSLTDTSAPTPSVHTEF